MKREFIKGLIPEITDEQLKAIMDENGKDVETLKTSLTAKEQELATKTTEAEAFKTQLAERDNDITALKEQAGNSEALNAKITELQGKYDTDTKALSEKLAAQEIDFNAEKFFSNIEFTSEAAKKAAIADFKAKGLKYDNGKFLGADDFLAEYKTNDPGAFKAPPEPPADPPPAPPPGLPYFAGPTKKDPKKASLAEMMKLKNENPNAKISFGE